MNSLPKQINYKVVIIGYGRVGRFFESLLQGIPRVQVVIKTREQKNYPHADLYLICVQDQQIPFVVNELALHEQSTTFSVAHCSGFTSLSILDSLKNIGCQTAVLHPVAPITFETKSADNMVMDALGDEGLMKIFEYWCSEWGARFVRVTEAQKKSIHIAAVMSCNYLMVLYGHVQRYLKEQGMESIEVANMLKGMMGSSLEQVDLQSVEQALTGPIIRGDISTIVQHLNLLKEEEQLLDLYRSLGTSTLDLIDHFSEKPLDKTIVEMRDLFK